MVKSRKSERERGEKEKVKELLSVKVVKSQKSERGKEREKVKELLSVKVVKSQKSEETGEERGKNGVNVLGNKI